MKQSVIHGLPKTLSPWWLPAIVAVICVLLQINGLSDELRFQREDILAGAWWRLITGHLLHLSGSHLVINLAALALIWELWFSRQKGLYSFGQWLIILLFTSLGLLAFSPEIQWYVGLSGSLHGLLVLGVLDDKKQRLGIRAAVLLIVGLKIGMEQWYGSASNWLLDMGPVVVDAHLYGAVSGGFVGVVRILYHR